MKLTEVLILFQEWQLEKGILNANFAHAGVSAKFIAEHKEELNITSDPEVTDEYCICPVDHAKWDKWCPCCGKKLRP